MAVALLQIQAIGPQSVLRTSGPAAGEIGELWNVLLLVGAIVTTLTFAALAIAILRKREAPLSTADRARNDRKSVRAIVVAGIVVPSIVLSGVFAITMDALDSSMTHGTDGAPRRPAHGAIAVEISGHQYWWRVRYLDADSTLEFESANELHIPVGVPVELRLTSKDVIHSFWVPGLHGKMDLIPGHRTRMTIQADRAGMWRGQCAEYCGMQHTLMAFQVVASSPSEFAHWQLQQRRSAIRPDTSNAIASQGHDLFMRVGCAPCHSIRGTAANGVSGPELTHIGSRLTLAAGSFPNTIDNLASWIRNPDLHKRGSGMPSLPLTDAQAQAIARYLTSLR
jgi:cytochrome c oxidase subunit 2